ncbi:MAG: dienelactone hydrolase family protein [Rhodospirillales bacterium]|nr:MAG: dienelactone hydrolase family protein [Rhodospirillales bacterium]
MGSMIEYKRPDGGANRGYLAMAGQGKPGIIVIQEWWGLNDQIMGAADRFARAGFNALAPDLYKGRVTQKPDEANHLMTGLDFPGATHQDIAGAAAHLKGLGGKVGVMGYCMGGALTVASAVHVPGLSAAVCYYGIPPADFADPAKIKIPFQGHFANRDDWCTPAAAQALEKAMKGAGQSPDIHFYEANHGFSNERSEQNYDTASANLAWERTLAFLGKNL